MNDNSAKEYILIPGLEESDPVSLTPLQQAVQPYALGIEAFWWALWGGVSLYVAIRFLVIPFVQKFTR